MSQDRGRHTGDASKLPEPQGNPDVRGGARNPAYTPTNPQPHGSTRMNKKHLIGYTATGIVALFVGIGAGAGSGGGASAGATPTVTAPATTVTASVPGSTTTVPGPTVTVKVPGPATTVIAPPPPPAAAMAGDGTYQVGVDVQPGTYVAAPAASGNCYWARLNGGDGLDNIIVNGNTSGPVVVTIKQSDKLFESHGCSDWSRR